MHEWRNIIDIYKYKIAFHCTLWRCCFFYLPVHQLKKKLPSDNVLLFPTWRNPKFWLLKIGSNINTVHSDELYRNIYFEWRVFNAKTLKPIPLALGPAWDSFRCNVCTPLSFPLPFFTLPCLQASPRMEQTYTCLSVSRYLHCYWIDAR